MKNILIKGLFVSASVIFLTSSASAMTCTNLTKALSKGSENSEVLKLQEFLFDGGYLSAKPNGYFGNGTVMAVKKFQSANGLSQVGSVGPGTREKIKELGCVVSSSDLNAINYDEQRKKDITLIANALKKFADDHSGKLPVYSLYKDSSVKSMGSESEKAIISLNKEICANVEKGCGSYADISELIPKYLDKLPVMRGAHRINGIGYNVKKTDTTVTVSAPSLKGKESLSISVVYSTQELADKNKGKKEQYQVTSSPKFYEAPVTKEEFTADLSAPKPTLMVSANPAVVEPEKDTTISWKSSSTVWCSIVGKGQGFGRGADATKRKSNDAQGIIVGNSLLTATVTCKGKNGDLISKEVLVRVKSPNEPPQSQKQSEPGVKRYEMYMSRNLTMVSYLTKSEALDHCVNTSHKNNPKSSIECMWGDEKIYSFMGESDLKFFKDVGI